MKTLPGRQLDVLWVVIGAQVQDGIDQLDPLHSQDFEIYETKMCQQRLNQNQWMWNSPKLNSAAGTLQLLCSSHKTGDYRMLILAFQPLRKAGAPGHIPCCSGQSIVRGLPNKGGKKNYTEMVILPLWCAQATPLM